MKVAGEQIADLQGFIRKRRQKGKTAAEAAKDLEAHGYDYHAARGLIMMYWDDEPESSKEQ